MVPVNRRQLSLYDEAKAGFSSLVRQTTLVFVSFVVILLLTGGAPSSFAIALSFGSGIAFVAWSEQRRITKLRAKDTTNSSGNINHKLALELTAPLWTVDAELEANKENIYRGFAQRYDDAPKDAEAKYQAELQAKDKQIALYQERYYSDIRKISILMSQQVSTVIKATKATSDNTDSNHKIEIGNIGGDFNASGSALNLGDISGTVTNTLQQLQTANHPNAPQIADLLKQLQTAINDEPDLPPEDKAEALTEVNVLAEAGKNPQKETQQKKANTALEILKSTIAALTPTAALVKACSELLPAITKLLGL
jgi:hypothetical protein